MWRGKIESLSLIRVSKHGKEIIAGGNLLQLVFRNRKNRYTLHVDLEQLALRVLYLVPSTNPILRKNDTKPTFCSAEDTGKFVHCRNVGRSDPI